MMNVMRINCLFVLVSAALFFLTCYEPLDPTAPKGMEMNVLLVTPSDNSGFSLSSDTLQTFDISRQFRLKIITAGTSQFDSFSVVIKSEVDTIQKILPFRYYWADTVWSQIYTVSDTMKRTIMVTGFANGLSPITKQCAAQMHVLFFNSPMDTVFNEDITCSIGLKAVGTSDSLDFFISNLIELKKIFGSSSLNLTRNGKDTATFNFTPLGNPGNYIIPIVAIDSKKIWSDTFFLKAQVQYVDLKPTIDTIIGSTVVKEGEQLALEVVFSNHDGDTNLTISYDKKFSYADFLTLIERHQGKATLVWNTARGDATSDSITFVVKDNGMLADTERVSFTIEKDTSSIPVMVISGDGGYVSAVYQNSDSSDLKIVSSDTLYVGFSDSAILDIISDTGYHIDDVIIDGLSKGRVAKYRFDNVRMPHEVRVEYALNQYYFSLVSNGHGMVTPPIMTKIDHGTVLEIAAIADDGYKFVKWNVSGDAVLADTYAVRTTVTVMGDSVKIGALFAPKDSLSITGVFAGKGGFIELMNKSSSEDTIRKFVSADTTYTVMLSLSDTVIFSIVPEDGYHIADVIVDGLSNGRIEKYRFTDGGTLHEIRAEFAFNQYTFSLVSEGNGAVTPSITAKIDHGTVLEIAAIADEGYHFVKWKTSGYDIVLADSLAAHTAVVVKGDSAKIRALFNPDSARITAQPVGKNVFEEDTVVFSVSATGFDIKYQWIKGDIPITDAVTSRYTTIAALSDSGTSIRCIVSNIQNSVTSDAVVLGVKRHSVHPTSIEIIAGSAQMCAGDSTTLAVKGGSLYNGALWKWYSAACGGSYVQQGDTITVTPEATTTYYVRAEGQGDTTRCAAITILVNTKSTSPIAVFANPSTVCPGVPSVLSFTGGMLGTGAQWKWYKGSCGNSFEIAGTGASITVSPYQTTTYYLRAEGQCSTTVCTPDTVKIYTFIQKNLTEANNATIIGDTAKLKLTNPSAAVPVNDWKWFINDCTGASSDSTISTYIFPRCTTTCYVHDMGNGLCDTAFFDIVLVDSVKPFALYTFNGSNMNNSSDIINRLRLDMVDGSVKWVPGTAGEATAKFEGNHYLQAPQFPFFPGNEFTISLWFLPDSSRSQYLFQVGNSGVKLDCATKNLLTITSFFNGDDSTSLMKITRNQWCYLVYKVTQKADGNYQIETWRRVSGSSLVCLSSFTSTKKLVRNSELFFGAGGKNPSPDSGGFFGQMDKIRIYAYPIKNNKMDDDFATGQSGN